MNDKHESVWATGYVVGLVAATDNDDVLWHASETHPLPSIVVDGLFVMLGPVTPEGIDLVIAADDGLVVHWLAEDSARKLVASVGEQGRRMVHGGMQ